MHQLVLLTALSASAGLFGGQQRCQSGRAMVAPARPAYSSCSPCATAPAYNYAPAPTYAPAMPAQPYAAPQAAPAPQGQAVQQAPVSRTSFYYAPVSSCASGNCSVR